MSTEDYDADISILKKGDALDELRVISILEKTKELFYAEPNVLELRSEIYVVGDVHGQLYDVLSMFNTIGGYDRGKFLFLGDYVDRGYQSINLFLLLCCLKLKRPNDFFLLRGNHEDREINKSYGLHQEVLNMYGGTVVYNMLNEVFDFLPISAIIDNKVFCVHGGITPDFPSIDEICLEDRFHPVDSEGKIAGLLWSDPNELSNGWIKSSRGAGYEFGKIQYEKFMQQNKLENLFRSHQLADEGFKWYFGTLLLVWSAPDYEYRSGNKATVVNYKNGTINIKEFPKAEGNRKIMNIKEPINGYFA